MRFTANQHNMSEKPSNEARESIRKFSFRCAIDDDEEDIVIPELLLPGYSFYTWPSASVLAWFLWLHRENFVGKRILEIGCGTALPGILAAKFGADVILSDSCMLPESLKHTKRCCRANKLEPGKHIEVIGLTWGVLLKSVSDIGHLDYIIAADCFYDPSVFEDILVTISFLLNASYSSSTKFLCTYQERSSDWSIENLLQKWKLQCSNVSLKYVEELCPIDFEQLTNGHEIRLLEITKLNSQ